MKIAILDDYQDAVRSLECFSVLDGHGHAGIVADMADPRDGDP